MFFCKISLGFSIQIHIDHSNTQLLKPILYPIDPSIASCLSQMDQSRLCHLSHIFISPFNLIYGYDSIIRPDPVCPSFYLNVYIPQHHGFFQNRLRLITGPHASLNFPVHPAPGLHSLHLPAPPVPVVQISALQQKFHQIPDRYPYIRISHNRSSPKQHSQTYVLFKL